MARRLHDLSEDSHGLRALHSAIGITSRPPTKPETPGQRYIRHLENQGYGFVDLPELYPLMHSAQAVRGIADGYTFCVFIIFDRDQAPESRLTLSPKELYRTAERCLKYSGKFGNTQAPAVIQIVEFGAGIVTPEEKARQRRYGTGNPFDMAMARALLVDTASLSTWSAQPIRTFATRKAIERLLRDESIGRDAVFQAEIVPVQNSVLPVVACLLSTVMIIAFVLELLLTGRAGNLWTPSLRAIGLLGANSRDAVLYSAEFWRLLTAPLLHLSALHLLSNVVAMLMVSFILEHLIGRAWIATIFLSGATLGGLFSLVTLPEHTMTVGASGGVLALSAASLVLFHRLQQGEMARTLVFVSLSSLVPALLPFASAVSASQPIDYGSHVGGLIAGAALGVLILKSWPRDRSQPAPHFVLVRTGSAGLAVAFGVLLWRTIVAF